MGTFIVAMVLLIVVMFIIYHLIQQKKRGNSLQCGSSCKDCGGHCHR